MALPGHSPPPPFAGPGSPTRLLNGFSDNQLPPMYGPPNRPMLPPSPKNFRFPNPPPPMPVPSPLLPTTNETRIFAPHKRPGSSMSISSMLGGEPDRSMQDNYHNHDSRGSSRHGSISTIAPGPFSNTPLSYQMTKSGTSEYSFAPRSQTPEQIASVFNTNGSRQRSSSSGTPLQRSMAFAEPHARSASTIPIPRYLNQSPSMLFGNNNTSRIEQDERVRRTSLSGILQRSDGQTAPESNGMAQRDPFRQKGPVANHTEQQARSEPPSIDPFQQNGIGSTYDIRPPGLHTANRVIDAQISPTRGRSMPGSPDSRRTSRSLVNILNDPQNQNPEGGSAAALRMSRQDSGHSQSDRGKFRQYSPFSGTTAPHSQSSFSIPADEPTRKGSDELSQHRTLLGLAAESKRGRFSPMPQVMQGVQAQIPVPDAGVKTERGRVFSGLGGGMSPTPAATSMKRDGGRTPLNEDNLKKMSKSISGQNKRSRKLQDDEIGPDTDGPPSGRGSSGRASKKGRYQQNHKADLEDLSNQAVHRKGTPLANVTSIQSDPPLPNNDLGGASGGHQMQKPRHSEPASTKRTRKTIKVASIFNFAAEADRRHLGSFTYRPKVGPSELSKPSTRRFDISIRPNLLPSFSATEHLNCTYTIHIPKLWLQERERGLICAERYLWGSGIYTDDSDPVAAAMHAGFLKASFGEAVDVNLLTRVIQEQNPSIEWPESINLPSQPLEIEEGKDLNITLIVLPLLEQYSGTARFGIKSRSWPEGFEKTQHDGVSFGIQKVEFVNIGNQEMRMGRTGASRRQRLRIELEARQQGLQMERDKVENAKQKRIEQLKSKAAKSGPQGKRTTMPTSAPKTAVVNLLSSAAGQTVPVMA